MATLKMVAESKAHSGCITEITFAPDGKQLVSTGTDGLTMIWNLFMT